MNISDADNSVSVRPLLYQSIVSNDYNILLGKLAVMDVPQILINWMRGFGNQLLLMVGFHTG